jgi:hypothetical protein
MKKVSFSMRKLQSVTNISSYLSAYYSEASAEDESETDSKSDSSDMETDEEPPEVAEDSWNPSPTFRYHMNRWWKHYRPKLLSDYVRVAYLLCPVPIVIEHAKKNRDQQDDEAVDRLIEKLFVPSTEVDTFKRMTLSATLLDKFWSELKLFRNRQGVFASEKIWYLAQQDTTKAFDWHYKYSLGKTEVLGKLACIVTSKICGIGEAERHWKSNKRQLIGQRNRLGPYKTMQQAYVSAAYCHKRSAKRREIASRAGKLYDDNDFSTCKFDAYCVGDILPRDKTITRIFRAWCEDWEKTRFNSSGCQLFEAQFSKKYGGLMFSDVDKGGQIGWTMDDNCAVLQRCYKSKDKRTVLEPVEGYNWYYALLVCYDGFATDKFYHQQNDDLWDLWELPGSDDFYEMVTEYYKESTTLKVYQRGECEEYDPKDRMIPFKGLLLCDFPNDSEEDSE